MALVYSCSNSSDENGDTTAVPLPPTNLTGTIVSSTQINLSWTDNSTDETGFKIERKTLNGTYVVIGTTNSNVNTFNDTGLTTNTTYVYRVYSYNVRGNSATYSNEVIIQLIFLTVTDIDGNIYPTVKICNQTWTTLNLNVSKYKNGENIPQVSNPSEWANLNTGAWCYNPSGSSTYGKLYNWYAVNDPRGLAPNGYRIPNDNEWNSLINCLGGDNIAGGKMKEIGTSKWLSPNTGATNSSGFNAFPGGYRNYGGSFEITGKVGRWWSSSISSSGNLVNDIQLNYNNDNVTISSGNKNKAFSVRLIKN